MSICQSHGVSGTYRCPLEKVDLAARSVESLVQTTFKDRFSSGVSGPCRVVSGVHCYCVLHATLWSVALGLQRANVLRGHPIKSL